jgi:hemerythrin-like domain-containing protein
VAARIDAINLLLEDHKKVRKLLEEFEETTERAVKTRQQLLKDIETDLAVHSQLEEELFYPAFKVAAETSEDRKLFFEAHEEHHVVDFVIAELKDTDPATEPFGAKAKLLRELVEHHADEEEKEMFPRARSVMTENDLVALGEQIEERRAELLTERMAMPKPLL